MTTPVLLVTAFAAGFVVADAVRYALRLFGPNRVRRALADHAAGRGCRHAWRPNGREPATCTRCGAVEVFVDPEL